MASEVPTRSPVECTPVEGDHQDSLLLPSSSRCPAARRRWRSRVNEHACQERRVESRVAGECERETKRNRNTCMPRADGGTRARAHALWPLWIFSLSPVVPPLSLSLARARTSLFRSSLFLYTQFCAHASPVFTGPGGIGARATAHFYSPRIATSDDLFSSSVHDCATFENVKEPPSRAPTSGRCAREVNAATCNAYQRARDATLHLTHILEYLN